MSNYFHDQAALEVATQIMYLVNGPKLLGGDAQLKAKIQCLIIDVLEQYGRKPAAGEPVAWARQCDLDESDPAIFVAREEVRESGYNIPLYKAAPPAAAHGDEAALWEMLEELRTATDRQALPGAFIRVMWEAGCEWINARAAMRAQGDGDGK